MKPLFTAFQFLTIIPVRLRGELSPRQVAASAALFPLVGLFQGALITVACFFSLRLFSPAVTAAVIMLVYLVTNGGFHMDGLADTFDALSIKSSGESEKDRQRRLAVMKDSTSGPIGVTSIVLSLLFKYVLLKEVSEVSGYSVLLVMPVISAWSMTMIIPGARSARPDGLGRIFFDGVKRTHAVIATVLTAGISGAVYFFMARAAYGDVPCFVTFFLAALVLTLSMGCILRSLCTARFGGLTGDNLGAIRETSDILVLLAAVLWL